MTPLPPGRDVRQDSINQSRKQKIMRYDAHRRQRGIHGAYFGATDVIVLFAGRWAGKDACFDAKGTRGFSIPPLEKKTNRAPARGPILYLYYTEAQMIRLNGIVMAVEQRKTCRRQGISYHSRGSGPAQRPPANASASPTRLGRRGRSSSSSAPGTVSPRDTSCPWARRPGRAGRPGWARRRPQATRLDRCS